MEVMCIKYKCIYFTLDGSLIEFHKDRKYQATITDKGKISINEYFFTLKEFHKNFITLADIRDQRITNFLKCI